MFPLQPSWWVFLIRNKHIHMPLIYDKGSKNYKGEKTISSTSGSVWENQTYKTMRLEHPFSSVQFNRSVVSDTATPWIAARQASLSITHSQSSLISMSIESVMPSSHLILCRSLLLLPLIPPSIRVFSNESTLRMRWPKYQSFSFSIIPSKEIPGLISFRMDWLDLLQFFGAQTSSQSNSHIHTWPQEKP